jgi:hypothetical protein
MKDGWIDDGHIKVNKLNRHYFGFFTNNSCDMELLIRDKSYGYRYMYNVDGFIIRQYSGEYIGGFKISEHVYV